MSNEDKWTGLVIRNCPFCGECAFSDHMQIGDRGYQVTIHCGTCSAQKSTGVGKDLDMMYEIGIKNWNFRAEGKNNETD